jgi:hypothetical protein
MVTLVNIVTHAFPKLSIGRDAVLGVLPFYHIYGVSLIPSLFFSGDITFGAAGKVDDICFFLVLFTLSFQRGFSSFPKVINGR